MGFFVPFSAFVQSAFINFWKLQTHSNVINKGNIRRKICHCCALHKNILLSIAHFLFITSSKVETLTTES